MQNMRTKEEAIIVTADRSNMRFALNGREAEALSALRSPVVVDTMIRFGISSLEMAARGINQETEIPYSPGFFSLLFDYALDAAPRVEGQENLIDAERLIELNATQESIVGKTNVDPIIIQRIQVGAQTEIDLRAQPRNDHDA